MLDASLSKSAPDHMWYPLSGNGARGQFVELKGCLGTGKSAAFLSSRGRREIGSGNSTFGLLARNGVLSYRVGLSVARLASSALALQGRRSASKSLQLVFSMRRTMHI